MTGGRVPVHPAGDARESFDARCQVHELKCWPPFFGAVLAGLKPFEVRKNDRGFQRGDGLRLREWDPHRNYGSGGYTGRDFPMTITYVLQGGTFGIEAGYCVLGLGDV